jgi:CBS domain-containing protein
MSGGLIDALSISNFTTKNVKTAYENQSIKQAIKTMYENDIGCLVIVSLLNSLKPVGIITERDIMRILSQDEQQQHLHLYKPTATTSSAASFNEISFFEIPVQSFMNKPVITISVNGTLGDAIQIMQQNNIRRLPVVVGNIDDSTNEVLAGIVTEKDIMKAIAKNRSIFCDLADRLPSNSLMIERIREIGLSELFFWPPGDSTGPPGP